MQIQDHTQLSTQSREMSLNNSSHRNEFQNVSEKVGHAVGGGPSHSDARIAIKSKPHTPTEYVITWEQYEAYQKQYYLTSKTKNSIKGVDIRGNYLLQSPSGNKTWRITVDKKSCSFDTLRPPVFIVDLESSRKELQSQYQNLMSQVQIIADDCAAHFFVSDSSKARCSELLASAREKQRDIKLIEDQLKTHHNQRNAEILKHRSEITALKLTLLKVGQEKLDAFEKHTTASRRDYDTLCQEYYKLNGHILLLGERLDKIEQETDVLDLFVISEQPKAIAVGPSVNVAVSRK